LQALRKRTREAARPRLRELQRAGVSGDDAFHRFEEELDLADLAVDRRELVRGGGAQWSPSNQTKAQKIGIQQPLDRHPLRFEILEGRHQ
jgi:hypothetical protein